MRSFRVSNLIVLSLGAAVAFGAAIARAQSPDANESDKHFVSEALSGGLAEVQMGQLAEQRSNSSDVKEFGRKMVEDLTRMSDEMKQIAGDLGVSAPDGPTTPEQAKIKQLNRLSGDQFDREYIQAMVKDHEDDLKEFKKEADTGKSPTVKDAAGQGANLISNHLLMIRQIAQSHNIQTK